jgi:hypothetical protein
MKLRGRKAARRAQWIAHEKQIADVIEQRFAALERKIEIQLDGKTIARVVRTAEQRQRRDG